MKRRNNISATNVLYPIVLIGSCLFSLLQMYALPHSEAFLIALSNRTILILWIIGIGLALFKRMTRPIPSESAPLLVIAAFSVAACMITAAKAPSSIVDAVLSTLGFLALPIMISYTALFKIDFDLKPFVYAYIILLSGLFIWLYHTDLRHAFETIYGVEQIEAVTLGYNNPNQTAMYLFVCVIGLVSAFSYFRPKLVKLFLLLDVCYISWLLVQTQSRTATLLLAAFLILVLYSRRRSIPKSWPALSVLAPVIYLLLLPVTTLFQKEILVMGQNLFTGRDAIYNRYLSNVNFLTFFLGDLRRYMFQNLHNGYLAIAASAGIFTCLGYFWLLRSHTSGNLPRRDAPVEERTAFIGFLCLIIYTSSEAAFFVGGAGYAFLIFSIFSLFAKPFATGEN